MRIALLAPLYESVPPQLYGGTERVVSWLAEELVQRGHEVTLFASGDSRTSAELVPVIERSLRLDDHGRLRDPFALHLAMARQVRARARDFDVIHSHIDYLGFPALQDSPVPVLTTLHGRLDIEGLPDLHSAYTMPVVSISDAQREPLPEAAWLATVYHGLPIENFTVGSGRGDYVAFVGRLSREKRPEVAIQAARRAGVRLVIAAKVDESDREFYEDVVAPMLRRARGVEFIGEVDDREKVALLRDARALLFPVLWPEPFGLAMIEAMACGTPVITRRCGSTPELVTHGHTGFVCDDDDALIDALGDLDLIDRSDCRREVEERFCASRMAADYEAVYLGMAEQSRFDVRRPPRSLTSPRSPRHLRGA